MMMMVRRRRTKKGDEDNSGEAKHSNRSCYANSQLS